jgi:AraC-like DNA-binding protein
MLIKSLANNLIGLPKQWEEFAISLYQRGLLTMLVVLILRACIYAENHQKVNSRKHLLLDDLFIYIRSHITEEITLEKLEQTFYVSKYHISREFKRQTGITVHQYIIKAKLDLCKRLIEQGKPIIEVYKLCGFGGYNHLFRAFKKEFGITPKEYFRQKKEEAKI